MAHSLEIRVPFVDVDLFDAVLALHRAGEPPGKRDMAATPAKALPRPVLERKKSGFGIPVRQWLLGDHGADASDRGLRGWAKLLYAAKAGRAAG
jgi:asparagine synthase (glutamine-hydrolysing)